VVKKGILVVVSGFSGAGKGTLLKKLIAEHENYALSVSMTTRSKREGEVDGRDYHFVSRDEFEERIAAAGFVEHATYVGNYYGTPTDYMEKMLAVGKNVLLEIEIQGALQVKKKCPEALLLFITPPNVTELKRRLIKRGTESEEVVRKRLHRACEEVDGVEEYDFIVINDDLDECVRDLHGIITAARFAPTRIKDFIQTIKEELLELEC
jgi:guanylate kinase